MAVLPSSPPMTRGGSSTKLSLGSWILLAGLQNLSIPSAPTISVPRLQKCPQGGQYEVCGEGKETSSRPLIGRQGWTLPTSISTGLWWTGEGYYGQIRPKSAGLGQMGINGPGKGLENHYQTGLLHLLSSMEEEVLWFGAVWDGMGWGSN